MKINAHEYESLTGLRAHYGLRKTTIRWQVSRAAEKSLDGTAADGEDIGAVQLADGTVLANIQQFRKWAKERGRSLKFTPPKTVQKIDPSQYMTFMHAADEVGVHSKSVVNAVGREEIPIIVLPFGTRIVRPLDVATWQTEYKETMYELDVGSIFTRGHHSPGWRSAVAKKVVRSRNLIDWAKSAHMPARVLLQRIKDGWDFGKALITPVNK